MGMEEIQRGPSGHQASLAATHPPSWASERWISDWSHAGPVGVGNFGEKKTRKLTCFFWGGTCEARKFTGPAGSDRNYYLLSRLVYFTYLGDLPPT